VTGHELARELLALPDHDVADDEMNTVTAVSLSEYSDDHGDHPYINLEMSELD